MANVLIVHASRYGQTEKIAQRMASALRSRGHDAELLDAARSPRTLELQRFQVALVGAPVYAGSFLPSIVRFVREHRDFLQSVRSAFFPVSLAIASRTSDGRAEVLPIVQRFTEQTGWRPDRVELLAGALNYRKYNFLIRYVMRRISSKAGGDTDTSRDFEYTDWGAVERFAVEAVEGAPEAASVMPPPVQVPAPPPPAAAPRAP